MNDLKASPKIDGNVKDKFTLSLDRKEDDYLIMFVDNEFKTDNYYMGQNPKKIADMLLTLYYNGNSAIKLILGSFISNVINIETKRNYDETVMAETAQEQNLNNLKVN